MFAWERQPSEFTDISSLDEKLIRGVVRLGVERGRLSDLALTESIGDVLGKWKLTTGDRPLNAATALFTKDTGMYTQFTMRLARSKELIRMSLSITSEWKGTSSCCLMRQ